jgi:hypothetical protein
MHDAEDLNGAAGAYSMMRLQRGISKLKSGRFMEKAKVIIHTYINK